MLGGILRTIAFAACLLSVLSYVECHRRGGATLLRTGRVFFTISALAVMSSAATLLYLILTHQFQYTNVWS